MTATETFEKVTRLAREYTELRAAYRTWYDAEVKRVYGVLRDEDKAAGRDTSGKSVATRRTLASDIVLMSDENRERHDALNAAEDAYRSLTNPNWKPRS